MPEYNIPERQFYKDLPISFTAHPRTGDVRPITNADAVKRSIKNLLLTNRGERFFNVNLGSDIRDLLFENFDAGVETAIEKAVRNTIEQYEPRAELLNVTATANTDQNALDVTVTFRIANEVSPITLDVILERIR